MYNVHDVVIPDHQTFCGIKNEFEKLKLRTNAEDKTHPDDGNMLTAITWLDLPIELYI
jgi:hypothetical protein